MAKHHFFRIGFQLTQTELSFSRLTKSLFIKSVKVGQKKPFDWERVVKNVGAEAEGPMTGCSLSTAPQGMKAWASRTALNIHEIQWFHFFAGTIGHSCLNWISRIILYDLSREITTGNFQREELQAMLAVCGLATGVIFLLWFSCLSSK